jgi:hypothetical protein
MLAREALFKYGLTDRDRTHLSEDVVPGESEVRSQDASVSRSSEERVSLLSNIHRQKVHDKQLGRETWP